MSGLLLKLITFLAVAAMMYFGARRIWRDWSGAFKDMDKKRHERDLRERERDDVVSLKRGKDGVFHADE